MSKHTKGKWIREFAAIKTEAGQIVGSAYLPGNLPDYDDRNEGESWLDCYARKAPERGAQQSEMEANANMFAAAPELLGALEEAVKDLVAAQVNARTASKNDPAWEGVSEAIQPSIDKARNAIAKARGDA